MIVTELYKGQGLGNQLWCYVTTRVIAINKGYQFGIQSPENFKGSDFMDLDFGKQVFGGIGPEGGPPQILPEGITRYHRERKISHANGSDIRVRDDGLINILDNTKIDGCMQDVLYILNKKEEIKKWLAVSHENECFDYSSNDICVINFRGGGYIRDKDFFLPLAYWRGAVANMLKINKDFKFIVITDDVKTAKKFFPSYDVFHFSIAKDYVIIKNARYLILSNSSFAWFPAWLSETLQYCIAPKYWGRHNISDGYWSLGYNITPGWFYQDRDGNLQDYNACLKEQNNYMEVHESEFIVNNNFDGSENYVAEPLVGKITPPLRQRLARKITTAKVLYVTKSRETSRINALYEIGALVVRGATKKLATSANALFGWQTVHPELSKEEKEIFNLLKDKFHTVFDVGAREDLAFYNMKKDCDYHLFEPNKDFVKRLKKQISSLKEHSITVNEFSLADKNQENYTYYEKSQSFEINPYMKEDTETGDHYSVKTLDGYVAEKNIPHIDFLKIDAEGFDYKIIEGGLNLIKNDGVSYIQFEYWTGVKKFVDILGDTYNLYLIMEPVLLSGIQIKIAPLMNSKQRLVNYRKSLIKLDSNLIDLIDKKLAPIGLGGNILGIHKNIDEYEVEKLIFDVIEFAPKTPLLSKVGYKVKEIIRKSWPVTFASKIGGAVIESRTKRGWLSLQEITEYRKTIKIYDVFSFFNELDLLEIRLNILDAYVDYFVIVEATETFSGYPKPLYFKENKNRFKKWEHKIIHYVIDDTPTDESDLRSRLYQGNLSRLDRQIIHDSLTSSNIGKGVLHWFKEFYQKEVIKKALIDLNDNDICYISDLDEIWNPELLIDYSKDDVFKPIQIGYQYYLNNRSNEDWQGWTGTIITKYKNIKYDCLNHLRTHRKMRSTYTFLKNGGWHFAFQGGYDGAKTKIEEYKHFWYNPRGILPNLKMRVSENKDHRGRKNIKLWKDERGLPKFLLENKNKYKKFFK